MIEIAKALTEYQILTQYLIKKIEEDKYIDREELKDLLISMGYKIKIKED